ncbi:MAG: prepilin peptidase [Deltaproteobacteria bacterium]|nr:prepilin peptidase [Deltaproteobacteria bacterium]
MDPGTMLTLFSFLFGLIVGSFLNVCIHRIPLKISLVHPSSSCPQCNERIRFYNNIPLISYIILRGKCRFCKKPISIRYPIVELLSGSLSLALFVKYGLTPHYFLFYFFSASLIVVTFVDLHHQIIPDVISLPGILTGLAAVSLFKVNGLSWKDSLIGMIIGGGLLYLIGVGYKWLRKKEGMGMGDVKLLAMIGAWMGYMALPYIILISSLTGIIIGGGSLLLTRRGLGQRIPFGPFLVLGTLMTLFFQAELKTLWFSYLNLMGR